ncbi:ribosomal RNA small subunit methyltransferase A [Candidatus Nomurabacteria bacterium RIFCSPHIGHO2_01_FULL_40_12]|uniref:Ribosomal RNA small subunit methyltransferase A n=1 Tax=Candidatus Nomurabacteria bacterium RIFCSPHIGHO2_01_FULL_40_12 TaxID=1801737 RepID=A0A1F6V0K2_9BACT|nr:MAG: ribosomal RNA small subunit methyltransferase A [Candidatus Nomurabacteria bacterium RIFCSPHIGHO2_01_FULL_40_12]
MKLVTQKKFVPKKSFGQNFLKSELALRKIIEAGEIKENDVILEIGPGKGKLTEKLLERAKLVIAVEKDRELFEFLKIKFEKEIKANTLILACEDILNFNIGKKKYKIIANIPYNITGAILKKFLTAGEQPQNMVLMVQHEVAKRILARDGKESILSISVKAYGEIKMIMKVDARYFSPAPKVDSAIITIKNISHKKLVNLAGQPTFNEKRFWTIVKTGFAHKRKRLGNNLKSIFSAPQGQSLRSLGLGDKRAEDLSLADWIALTKI